MTAVASGLCPTGLQGTAATGSASGLGRTSAATHPEQTEMRTQCVQHRARPSGSCDPPLHLLCSPGPKLQEDTMVPLVTRPSPGGVLASMPITKVLSSQPQALSLMVWALSFSRPLQLHVHQPTHSAHPWVPEELTTP